MITPDGVRLLARYNRWQNRSLVAAADTLDRDARVQDRGAFFGSIQRTLVHVLWGDTVWMARFDGWDAPEITIGESPDWIIDWDSYCDLRETADDDILTWANGVDEAALAGELAWYSGALGRDAQRPKWLCIQHFFNHQTHHRGQVHAMLTAAGARPGDTDLFVMPEEA